MDSHAKIVTDSLGRVVSTVDAGEVALVVRREHRTALLLTDIQTAFMPAHEYEGKAVAGGGLPVTGGTAGLGDALPGGEHVVPVARALAGMFFEEQTYVALDRHPVGHVSFASSYDGLAPFSALTVDLVLGWHGNGPIVSPYFDKEYLLHYLSRCHGGAQVLWPDHALIGTRQADVHPGLANVTSRMRLVKGANPGVDSYSPFMDNVGNTTGLGERMKANGVTTLVTGGLAGDICAGLGALHARKEHGFETYFVKDMCRSVALEGELRMDALLLDAGVHIVQSSQVVER